jgi:hypothetical protein
MRKADYNDKVKNLIKENKHEFGLRIFAIHCYCHCFQDYEVLNNRSLTQLCGFLYRNYDKLEESELQQWLLRIDLIQGNTLFIPEDKYPVSIRNLAKVASR